jgi:hypothetical protein
VIFQKLSMKIQKVLQSFKIPRSDEPITTASIVARLNLAPVAPLKLSAPNCAEFMSCAKCSSVETDRACTLRKESDSSESEIISDVNSIYYLASSSWLFLSSQFSNRNSFHWSTASTVHSFSYTYTIN